MLRNQNSHTCMSIGANLTHYVHFIIIGLVSKHSDGMCGSANIQNVRKGELTMIDYLAFFM